MTCSDRHGSFTMIPRMVIDCSGDGDISAKAGVPFTFGDASCDMMAITISFRMLGVDWDRAFADCDPYFAAGAAPSVAEGRLHPDLAKLWLMRGFHPGDWFCNSVTVRGLDGTDPVAVAEAEAMQESRRRCHQLAQFPHADVPGFETAYMTQLSPNAEVRETRKLEGVYRVIGRDLARDQIRGWDRGLR